MLSRTRIFATTSVAERRVFPAHYFIPSDTALQSTSVNTILYVLRIYTFYYQPSELAATAHNYPGARPCLAPALPAKGLLAMSIVSITVFFAIWPGLASADNKTIVHGWVPEPDGRGTWSIVWSCLVTIFICTWSVLHLDVPDEHGRWYLFFRKVEVMLVTVLAPEFVLMIAVREFFRARGLLGQLVARGGDEWTLVHAEFAVAGGIRVKSQESDDMEPNVDGSSLRKAVESGKINEPPISKEELESRSKSDGIVKLIALLQITWFGLQVLFRAIQHLQVTALEIVTIAFFVLAVLIYAFCWNRPQGIEYPVIIKLQNADANGTNGSLEGNVSRKSRGDIKVWFTDEKYAAVVDGGSGIIIVLIFLAPLFGAIHCLAWDAPFPTPKEALAWRICAVMTMSLPLVYGALLTWGELDVVQKFNYNGSVLELFVAGIPMVLYVVARITLITLAFMSLRALPADAFRTIAWTNYVPNLGV